MRKHLGLFFLLLAYVILLGHSIIPHHHHESHSEALTHHDIEHVHDDGHGSTDIGHLLSHLMHADEDFTRVIHKVGSQVFNRSTVIIATIVTDAFCFSLFPDTTFQLKPPDTEVNLSSIYQETSALRGPPSFLS